MSFLRLSSVIVNTRYINRINVNPSGYSIHLMNTHSGDIVGSALFFWGSSSSDKVIDIDSVEQKEDYDIITNWVQEVSQKNKIE
jgi:hypothetical protein